MNHLVPSFIDSLSPYIPGKPIEETEREYGIRNIVKLASNENPLGPSPRATQAMTDGLRQMHLYPDASTFYLRNELAAFLGVEANELMLGNGSNELIELLIRTFVHGDEEILTSANTFPIYKISAQAVGRKLVEVPMRDRHYDLEAMAAAVHPKTRLVFLANPDNPTGTYQTSDAVVRFLERVGERVLVVMDEAYFEYVVATDYPDSLALRERFPNLVILRTFSKAYGLAGIRVGYGIARKEVVDYVNRTRAPFNVSAIAQLAARAALGDGEHVKRTVELNRQGLALLGKELPSLGLSFSPSQANFYLVDFHRPVGPVFEALLREGVIVRPMIANGFPTSARINTGTEEENEKLLHALKKVLA
jgi:histidinol-phosphate aminotransferase